MDYEEKYKEALEKCRWMLANDKISKKSATELFRELKEITDIEIIEMISSIIASIQFPDEGMPMQMACLKWLEKQGEPRVDMIQWKGDNLREVLEFTGKNKNFDKWFASFEEFEEYVHEHNDIFKIFNDDDGGHCEVPVGAWIVKTPDGYNVPSKAKYKQKIEQKPAWSEEDERIRKSLIESYTNQHPSNFPTVDGFTREQILAWLEKQGEQKSITFNDDRIIDSALNDYCCKQYNALDKENGGVLSFARLQHLAMDIYGWCKKQGEQKPADKVEPKFREGDSIQFKGLGHNRYTIKEVCGLSHYINTMGSRMDMSYTDANFEVIKDSDKVEPKFHKGEWVTNSTETVQINGYDIDYGYQVDYKGNLQHRDPNVIEKEYHLWTIRDAKDGDVLYTPKGCGVEGISLIKGWKQVDGTGRTLCSDIGYRVEDDEIIAGGLGAIWWEGVIDPFYPATKEQRDILFKKMKEAGYEWDAEKKELKKLEPKCDTCTNDKGCVTCVDGDQWEGKPKRYDSVDEFYADALIEMVEKSDLTDRDKKNRLVWIEKHRAKPAEWSEEDEKTIDEAVECLEKYAEDVQGGFSRQYVLDLASRVESLRPQTTWKPSDEQMAALRETINYFAKKDAPHYNDYLYNALKSLKQDLKKLM